MKRHLLSMALALFLAMHEPAGPGYGLRTPGLQGSVPARTARPRVAPETRPGAKGTPPSSRTKKGPRNDNRGKARREASPTPAFEAEA
jgi:hypothetical protein